jgi:hypothetical protein
MGWSLGHAFGFNFKESGPKFIDLKEYTKDPFSHCTVP